MGPDSGHVSEPGVGLIFASKCLLANELLSYAWLQWNREFETSFINRTTVRNVTSFRSIINRPETLTWNQLNTHPDPVSTGIPEKPFKRLKIADSFIHV